MLLGNWCLRVCWNQKYPVEILSWNIFRTWVGESENPCCTDCLLLWFFCSCRAFQVPFSPVSTQLENKRTSHNAESRQQQKEEFRRVLLVWRLRRGWGWAEWSVFANGWSSTYLHCLCLAHFTAHEAFTMSQDPFETESVQHIVIFISPGERQEEQWY